MIFGLPKGRLAFVMVVIVLGLTNIVQLMAQFRYFCAKQLVVDDTGTAHYTESCRDTASSTASHKSMLREDKMSTVTQHKPTFVMHIGPLKTATTFLQCSLCAPNVESILVKDNFAYLGACPLIHCEKREGRNASNFVSHTSLFRAIFEEPTSSDLKADFVQSILKLIGTNVIFIYELLHLMSLDQIQQFFKLLEPYWHVQIVVGYRPFSQWLPSLYNQRVKSRKSVEWPPANGPIAPFDPDSYETRNVTESHEMFAAEKHVVEIALEKFSEFWGQINVIPLHTLSPTDVPPGVDVTLHAFLCHAVKIASHTCQAVLEGRLEGDHGTNPSVSLDFDMLATAAYKSKLIPPGVSRSKVRAAISRAGHPMVKDKCLSNETLERFERLSWLMEERLFPMQPEWESVHRSQFAYLRDVKRQFCTINAEATLQDHKWIEFFADVYPVNATG